MDNNIVLYDNYDCDGEVVWEQEEGLPFPAVGKVDKSETRQRLSGYRGGNNGTVGKYKSGSTWIFVGIFILLFVSVSVSLTNVGLFKPFCVGSLISSPFIVFGFSRLSKSTDNSNVYEYKEGTKGR